MLRGPQFTAQPVPAALVWEGEEWNLHVCKRGPREVGGGRAAEGKAGGGSPQPRWREQSAGREAAQGTTLAPTPSRDFA